MGRHRRSRSARSDKKSCQEVSCSDLDKVVGYVEESARGRAGDEQEGQRIVDGKAVQRSLT